MKLNSEQILFARQSKTVRILLALLEHILRCIIYSSSGWKIETEIDIREREREGNKENERERERK